MFTSIFLTVCVLAQAPASVKKRIAVMDFEYTSGPGDGKGLADLITAQLAIDGRYTLIERKVVEKLATGDLADPRSAAKLGRLLGADGVVVGTATDFKGAIDINARFLSTQTSDILGVITGKGDSAALAVADISTKIDAFSEKVPLYVVRISGLVADVAGKTVVLNVGARSGLKVGDRLVVRRSTREVKDPTTGSVLRQLEDTVGEVTILEMDEMSSMGRFTGPALANVGDSVKNN